MFTHTHIYTHSYEQDLFCPKEGNFSIYKGILPTQTCPLVYLYGGS